MFQIAPSLLAADFWSLSTDMLSAVEGGANLFHVDVMDGHFVSNLSMGAMVVKAIKKKLNVTLDVHLMVTDPDANIDDFADAGADWISFHIEATPHAHRVCHKIRQRGCKAGIAINPGTSLSTLEGIIGDVDFVLLMSVNPGFGGQSFIDTTYQRIELLAEMCHSATSRPFIEVDGGIGTENIRELRKRGMQVAVAGSSVFGKPDPGAAVRQLIQASKDPS